MHKPLKERKKILQENMTEVKNRVMFSEMKIINVSFKCIDKNLSALYLTRTVTIAVNVRKICHEWFSVRFGS